MQSAKTTLLCAIRFWGSSVPGMDATHGSFRSAVRNVARKQGISPQELDRAERQLLRQGLIHRTFGMHPLVGLTSKGVKVAGRACPYVHLPPWRPYPHHLPPGARA